MASKRVDEEMEDQAEHRDRTRELRADQRADANRDYPELRKRRRTTRISRWRAARRRGGA